jgi:hypothetical protein
MIFYFDKKLVILGERGCYPVNSLQVVTYSIIPLAHQLSQA